MEYRPVALISFSSFGGDHYGLSSLASSPLFIEELDRFILLLDLKLEFCCNFIAAQGWSSEQSVAVSTELVNAFSNAYIDGAATIYQIKSKYKD